MSSNDTESTRTLTKDLRGGARVRIVGSAIYVSKYASRVDGGLIVRELQPFERVGSIALGADGYRVDVYCHTYGAIFPRGAQGHADAQDYALSLLS
jgi:hypothetical protein